MANKTTKTAKKPKMATAKSDAKATRTKKTLAPNNVVVRERTEAEPVVSRRSAVAGVLTKRMQRTFGFGSLVAEFIGVFALVLIFLSLQGQPIYVPVALVALALFLVPLSGAHLNPAFSIAMWTARKISGLRATLYVVAQVLGAMLALVVATALVAPTTDPLTGEATAGTAYAAAALPADTAGKWRLLGTEFVGMLVFSLAFASAFIGTTRSVLARAFTIGLGYMAGLLVVVQAGQILNPAIAFAAKAVQFELWSLAIYVLTPVIAAIIGVNLYKLLRSDAIANNPYSDEKTTVVA